MTLAQWSFILLALKDPRMTFRRLHTIPPSKVREKENGQAVLSKGADTPASVWEEPYPMDMSKRIPWVLALMVSYRLTDWKIGDPSHDKTQPPPRHDRLKFCKHALATIIQSYIILDAAAFYTQTDPYFIQSHMSMDAAFPPPSSQMPFILVLLRLLPPRLLRSAVLAADTYGSVTLLFYMPTLPAVGLNAVGLLPDGLSPQNWPVFFGPFSAVLDRGVRGLWGTWWHQMSRYTTSMPGRSLCYALQIPTSSILGYALITISAFFNSGVLHMGLVPPKPLKTTYSANLLYFYVAAFFWVQIVAFGVELIVSKLAQRIMPKASRSLTARFLTLIWVAAWLCLTLPIIAVPFREMRYWDIYPLPVSIWKGLSGNGWLTWT